MTGDDTYQRPDGTPKITGRTLHESIAHVRIDDTSAPNGRVVIHVEHPDHGGGERAFYRHRDSDVAGTIRSHLAREIDAADATGAGGVACAVHRRASGDDSTRGVAHPDDRTPLAYVYDGAALRATVFDECEVERYRDTALTVSLTPAGECRVDEECSVQDGGSV